MARISLRSRPGLNTAIGVTCAIIAGLLLLGYVSSALGGKKGGEPISVPVARRDIEAGSVVEPEMITRVRVPASYILPGTARKQEEVEGSRTLISVCRGGSFAVAALDSGDSIASRIPPQLRAYTLHTGSGAGSGPSLHAGDRVDVLSTSGDPPRTRTLLSRTEVLASTRAPGDQSGREGEAGGTQVTLLVSPGDAEILAQAEYEGEVSVSLCPLEPETGVR